MLTQRFSHRSSSHGGARENTTTKESTSQGVRHENQSKHKSEERYKKQAKKSFMGFLKLAIIKALKKK